MTSSEYGKIISKNLKRIAYDHQKSQADIARDLGLKQATVSSWMNGTRVPRMDKIDLLCHYFNCSRVDIMEEHTAEENDSYYINEDAREIAQFLFKNPDYRVLFDASRKVRKEDLLIVKELLDRFS